MKLAFNWKENKGMYQNGESLFLNRIRVAHYEWNSTRSKGDDNADTRYKGGVSLPSIVRNVLYGATPEDIKTAIEKSVSSWFNEALRKDKK